MAERAEVWGGVGWRLIVLGGLLQLATEGTAAETPISFDDQLRPGVVALANREGTVLGVLLNADGLIVTSATAVASPFPYRCQVEMGSGQRSQPVLFQRARILAIHPRLDLALFRIDPSEHRHSLRPAVFSTADATNGNTLRMVPGPGRNAPLLPHAVPAELLQADLVLHESPHYLLRAKLPAGATGGVLADETGQVLGLLLPHLVRRDGALVAAPLPGNKPEVYVPVGDRLGNGTQAHQLAFQAQQLLQRATQHRQGNRYTQQGQQLHNRGQALCREALQQDPGNAELYFRVGKLLEPLAAPEVATAYVLHAVELRPWDDRQGAWHHALGNLLVAAGQHKAGQAAWAEGVAKHPQSAPQLWEDLARLAYGQGEAYAAAHSAAIALQIGGPRVRPQRLEQIQRDAAGQLSAGDRQKLRQAVQQIPALLQRRASEAAAARQRGTRFLTPEFLAFVMAHGNFATASDAAGEAGSPPPSSRLPAQPEHRRRLARADPESAAASRLKIAERFIAEGKLDVAQQWLRRVIDRYPESEAAKTARQLLGNASPNGVRTWTDRTGRHQVKARLLEVRDGRVRLAKEQGETVTLSLDELSDADQAHLRTLGQLD